MCSCGDPVNVWGASISDFLGKVCYILFLVQSGNQPVGKKGSFRPHTQGRCWTWCSNFPVQYKGKEKILNFAFQRARLVVCRRSKGMVLIGKWQSIFALTPVNVCINDFQADQTIISPRLGGSIAPHEKGLRCFSAFLRAPWYKVCLTLEWFTSATKAGWSSELLHLVEVTLLMAGGWDEMIFKVLSNPNHSVTLALTQIQEWFEVRVHYLGFRITL